MGGTDVREPVELSAVWNYDLEWTEKEIGVDLQDFCYLSFSGYDYKQDVSTYVYELYGETGISIPFSASHGAGIYGIDIAWDDMRNNVSDTGLVHYDATEDSRICSFDSYDTGGTSLLGVTVDNEDKCLKFRRGIYHFNHTPSTHTVTVDNSTAAISPYSFTFVVRLDEYPSAQATVIVRQYPAIYIDRIISGENAITRFVNSFRENGGEDSGKGYLSATVSYDSNLYLGSLSAVGSTDNRNIYTVRIAKLSSLSDYIIADPRSLTVDNLDTTEASGPGNWSGSGVNLDTGEISFLENYYPTLEGEDYNSFMAPAFSMASLWAASEPLSREQAKRRCASYQEEGKPAGRWRLPTQAELLYMANLSVSGIIPPLLGFTSESNYNFWTASGTVYVNHGTGKTGVVATLTQSTKAHVRCVYDDWYWQDDDCDPEVFTWGDRKRDLSRSRTLLNAYMR